MNSIDYLINELSNTKDFFTPSLVIFDNLKMEQWFKNYWLKNKQDIYMNIKCLRFKDLYYMIFKNSNVKILDQQMLTKYLLISLSTWDKKEVSYIYDGDEINASRLLEYAKTLANLFIQYDNDLFTPSGFQKDLFDKVIEEANSDGYQTLMNLYQNGSMANIDNPLYIYVTRELTKLEEEIITKYNQIFSNKIEVVSLEQNHNKTEIDYLLAAPSSLREIEALHSEICKLLLKGVSASDICVYAPKIDEYIVDIEHVFKQSDSEYPNVPFNLTKYLEDQVKNVLKRIKNIIINQYCTRVDFINLLKNQDIRSNFGIDDEKISHLLDAIVNSNTYRQHNNIDDWLDLKRRILLSKLVDETSNEVVNLDVGDYLPFNSINCSDEEIIILSKIIDILNEFNLIALSEEATTDSINKLLELCQKLLFNNNDYHFYLMQKELNNIGLLIEKYDHHLSNEVVFDYLISLFNQEVVNYPLKGVSFLNLNARNIINTKYCYILGLSSNKYPRKQTISVINQNPVDDVVAQDKEVLKAVINNSEHIYVSYISCDLASDEKFYPTPLLKDYQIKNKPTISIDEARDTKELFTKREFKNREFYLNVLTNNTDSKETITLLEESKERPSLSLFTMESLILEPLSSKTKALFDIKDEEKLDSINTALEPLQINSLTRSIIIKNNLIAILNGNVLQTEEISLIKKEIPTYPFTDSEYDQLLFNCDKYMELNLKDTPNLKLEVLKDVSLSYYEKELLQKEKDLIQNLLEKEPDELKQKLYRDYLAYLDNKKINNDQEVNWTAIGGNQFFVDREDDLITYIDLKIAGGESKSLLVRPYLYALMDIASIGDLQEHQVRIVTSALDKEGLIIRITKTFNITSQVAQFILNKIHYYLSDYTELVFINIFKEALPLNYEQLELATRDAWHSFQYASLFEKEDLFKIVKNNEFTSPETDDFEKLYNILWLKHRLLIEIMNNQGGVE